MIQLRWLVKKDQTGIQTKVLQYRYQSTRTSYSVYSDMPLRSQPTEVQWTHWIDVQEFNAEQE